MAAAAILKFAEMANFLVYCPILVIKKKETNRINNPKLIPVFGKTLERFLVSFKLINIKLFIHMREKLVMK